MFEMEVPEIEDGVIEIRSIARYPGERAKIIVQSHDRRIDPVGACVGMRGSRIQAIVRELNNEKIDIVNYTEQSEILISRALSPAKPLNLYIDDDRQYCIAIFEDDELEMAIGRRGVNVNLASKVTGYKIDAFGKDEYARKQAEQEMLLANLENFPKRSIKPLQDNDINTISDLMNSEEEKLVEIKGITEKTLEKIYDCIQLFIEKNQKEFEESTSDESTSDESSSEESSAEKSTPDESPPKENETLSDETDESSQIEKVES